MPETRKLAPANIDVNRNTGGIGEAREHGERSVTDTTIEDLDAFRGRAAQWIEANLPSDDDPPVDARALQRTIFDGGFAGIPFPTEFGGAGLTLEHQQVFYDTAADLRRQTPTGSLLRVSLFMLGPTILDHGSDEAKRRFLPPLLRADEVWVQLLSEPRGGSDMAGATTRLTRDGDSFVLSGAKMWTTNANIADYGLCLCRSDWDAPKHRGLAMISVPLRASGVTIEQTRTADGVVEELCEELFDDVILPVDHLIGGENDGWTVAQTLLLHERNASANVGYGYAGPRGGSEAGGPTWDTDWLVRTALERGTDGVLRQQVAQVYIEEVVARLTRARVDTGMRLGTHQGPWGSLVKLQGAESTLERARIALAVAGTAGVIWESEDEGVTNPGTGWLVARGGTLAGGSNEMQRNIISERLLGLPREPSVDRDVPFRDVITNQPKPS